MLDRDALISVVIPNYNYARYIAEAIGSALAVDWARVEVIVVDDGSTDASRAVIQSFGNRIVPVFQVNQGQAAACAAGFRASRGEVIFFLDSDDLLHRDVVRHLAPRWSPAVSKVQFQMKTVDAFGRPLGTFLPQYIREPSPHEIRAWALKAAAYPTPPGSGNAYARWFVDRVFSTNAEVDSFSDSSLLAAAPFLGDVETVACPLVSYRIHGANDGAMAELSGVRLSREVDRSIRRFSYAQRVCGESNLPLQPRALWRSLALGVYRIGSLTLSPRTHPLPDDTRFSAVTDAWRGVLVGQGMSITARLSLAALITAVAVLPGSTGRALLQWRLIPASRPAFLSRALRLLGAIR